MNDDDLIPFVCRNCRSAFTTEQHAMQHHQLCRTHFDEMRDRDAESAAGILHRRKLERDLAVGRLFELRRALGS